MKAIRCLLEIHDWQYQYDAGRAHAVHLQYSSIWMSDKKVCCWRCGKVRDAKRVLDHALPEIIFNQR